MTGQSFWWTPFLCLGKGLWACNAFQQRRSCSHSYLALGSWGPTFVCFFSYDDQNGEVCDCMAQWHCHIAESMGEEPTALDGKAPPSKPPSPLSLTLDNRTQISPRLFHSLKDMKYLYTHTNKYIIQHSRAPWINAEILNKQIGVTVPSYKCRGCFCQIFWHH